MNNQLIKISENCWKHIDEDGDIYYRKTSDPNSELHREDGPAIEYRKGSKHWYINGKLHREDGPALDNVDGYKAWFINGKHHRKDGPSIELVTDYTVWSEWYYYGKFIDVKSQEEFEVYLKNLIFI